MLYEASRTNSYDIMYCSNMIMLVVLLMLGLLLDMVVLHCIRLYVKRMKLMMRYEKIINLLEQYGGIGIEPEEILSNGNRLHIL